MKCFRVGKTCIFYKSFPYHIKVGWVRNGVDLGELGKGSESDQNTVYVIPKELKKGR